MDIISNSYMPGDQRLIEDIVRELKSQGIFDQFRKECISDVDTKPAYQNLRQRVEGSVAGFLTKQSWNPEMNKNQVREMLRKNIYECGFLDSGVERIVDQVVNPKITSVFLPKVEDVVYKFLGIEKPIRDNQKFSTPAKVNTIHDLLPQDLEAISPEMPETPEENYTMIKTDEEISKIGNDESPSFELLCDKSDKLVEEISMDSQYSILSSHDSSQTQRQDSQVFLNNFDGQTSLDSFDSSPKAESIFSSSKLQNCNSNSEIGIKAEASLENELVKKHLEETVTMEEASQNEKMFEETTCKSKESTDRKRDKHHSSGRSKSRSDRDKDKSKNSDDKLKSDRHKKEKDDKDKKEKYRIPKLSDKLKSEKNAKDKDNKNKEKSDHKLSDGDKKSHREKKSHHSERERSKSASSSKDSKGDSNDKNDKKDKKDSSKKDKSKDHRKDYSSSSKRKESSSSKEKHNEKGKDSSKGANEEISEKNKNGRSSSSSKKDSSHSKREEDKSKSTRKKEDKSSRDKDDKKKKRSSNDDHYSSRDKKNGRRSSDRDSDGPSNNKKSISSPQKSSDKISSLKSNTEFSSNIEGSTGDSGNSERAEDNDENSISSNQLNIEKIKLPKFASNIGEAMKIMKIRKQLKKLESINRLNSNNMQVKKLMKDIEDLSNDGKKDKTEIALNKSSEENKNISEVVEDNNCKTTNLDINDFISSSNISMAKWDALEAKFIKEINEVDYNSYESPYIEKENSVRTEINYSEEKQGVICGSGPEKVLPGNGNNTVFCEQSEEKVSPEKENSTSNLDCLMLDKQFTPLSNDEIGEKEPVSDEKHNESSNLPIIHYKDNENLQCEAKLPIDEVTIEQSENSHDSLRDYKFKGFTDEVPFECQSENSALNNHKIQQSISVNNCNVSTKTNYTNVDFKMKAVVLLEKHSLTEQMIRKSQSKENITEQYESGINIEANCVNAFETEKDNIETSEMVNVNENCENDHRLEYPANCSGIQPICIKTIAKPSKLENVSEKKSLKNCAESKVNENGNHVDKYLKNNEELEKETSIVNFHQNIDILEIKGPKNENNVYNKEKRSPISQNNKNDNEEPFRGFERSERSNAQKSLDSLYHLIKVIENNICKSVETVKTSNLSGTNISPTRKRRRQTENCISSNTQKDLGCKKIKTNSFNSAMNKKISNSSKECNEDTTDVVPDNNFNLPLSPPDSEESNEKKIRIPAASKSSTRRSDNKKKNANSQRYSCEDLYKPRMFLRRNGKHSKPS